jgi:hypothetical protein
LAARLPLANIAADVLAALKVRYGVGSSAATCLGISGFGASFSLAATPAKVASPNRQRPFGLGRGYWS